MDKQAFKQRMQNLKSYRENNPGKGYWDWKVQAYQNGGRHALGVGQVFASLADMLFNKERRTPAIAAAAYYTIHQTQNDPVLAPVEAPLVEPIADAIKSVDETPYDPGEVFLLSPENQKKQMTKNPNYRVVDTNSEEDPYGIVRRAANYHKEIHGEVPVYEYIADSDTTIKRSNLIPVGTLPLGEYTPELPHAGSYNSVLYYNASNDKLYQRAYDLNDYGPTDTKDKGASSMYIGPIRWLSRQLDKAGTPFVQRTGFVPLDEGKYYNQLPESAKKKVRERRRLRNSYEYGGEVNEFQRKTRRDIMQESYEYQYDINGVPYGTTIHEMNHNADYLKNKAADADANSNLYYWMRSALKPFSRIDPNTDKLTKYYSKPTEQKAYMNQLREFMYANKMIDTRDQIVTPDLIKQAISKLPKGMQSIKKASEQFKSMRSYTKWFNTIPLLGVGAVGANKYFTSNENRD